MGFPYFMGVPMVDHQNFRENSSIEIPFKPWWRLGIHLRTPYWGMVINPSGCPTITTFSWHRLWIPLGEKWMDSTKKNCRKVVFYFCTQKGHRLHRFSMAVKTLCSPVKKIPRMVDQLTGCGLFVENNNDNKIGRHEQFIEHGVLKSRPI